MMIDTKGCLLAMAVLFVIMVAAYGVVVSLAELYNAIVN